MKNFILMTQIILSLFLVILSNKSVNANEEKSPKYLLSGAFALEEKQTLRADGVKSRRIATYLPYSTLIFDKNDKDENIGRIKEIEGKKYKLVLTQHGQKLYIRPKRISPKTFEEKIKGRQKFLIFHVDSLLCESQEDLNCFSGDEIQRGYFLEIVETNESSYKLKMIKDGAVITGYISKKQMLSFLSNGLVTDAQQKHPRYLLKKPPKSLGGVTNCGETKTEINIDEYKKVLGFGLETPAWLPFKVNFGTSDKNNEQVIIQSTIGGKNIAAEQQVMQVYLPNKKGEFSKDKRIFYISIVYACMGEFEPKPIYIKQIKIREDTKNFQKLGLKCNPVYLTAQFDEFYSKFDNDRIGKISQILIERPFLTTRQS